MANENKSGKGLKDISLKQMQKDFKKPALIVLGIAAGGLATQQIIKAINRHREKNKGTPVDGLLGINMDKVKKYIVPSATTLAGLAATQLIKNQGGKLIATGVAINGTILLANQALSTNMLAGLGKVDEEGGNVGTPGTPVPTCELPEVEENYIELAPSLYEQDRQPMGSAAAYIDSMMQEVEAGPAAPSFVPGPEQDQEQGPVLSTTEPEEAEVNLESNRPEDNFEMARPEVPEETENVSGGLEAIILEPEPEPEPGGYYDREFEEELDFTAIP